MNTTIKTLLSLAVLAIILGGLVFFTKPYVPNSTACTMEAKMCLDGSSVGRSGPSCEFAACPEIPVVLGWETELDPLQGVSFQYPASLEMEYVTAAEWPPAILVEDGYRCEDDTVTADGWSVQEVVKDPQNRYCKMVQTEGAAVSMYNTYAYTFLRGAKSATFSFTLRQVQCQNFDSPQKETCVAEQALFNPDSFSEKIGQTIVFGSGQ